MKLSVGSSLKGALPPPALLPLKTRSCITLGFSRQPGAAGTEAPPPPPADARRRHRSQHDLWHHHSRRRAQEAEPSSREEDAPRATGVSPSRPCVYLFARWVGRWPDASVKRTPLLDFCFFSRTSLSRRKEKSSSLSKVKPAAISLKDLFKGLLSLLPGEPHKMILCCRLRMKNQPWILFWETPSSSERRLLEACWTLRGRLESYVQHRQL